MRSTFRVVLTLLAIGCTICAGINVYGDDAAVRSDAEGVACPRGCPKASSVSVDRTPFSETLSFQGQSGAIQVRCTRAAILIGPYSCVRE